MEMNMRRKAGKMMGILFLLALMLTGCGESIQTDEEIVVPKENARETEMAKQAAENSDGGASSGKENEIAGQVQAPDIYQTEFQDGFTNVKAYAPVVLPEGEGFKLYRVTSRIFTQEDYDNVRHVLLKDGELWERDMEKMADSNGFTRQEIEERIAALKEHPADEVRIQSDKKVTYGELVERLEPMLEKAPEEPIIVKVPAVVNYSEGADQGEHNWLHGNVTLEDGDYFVTLDNNLQEDWRWINFEVRGPMYQGSLMPISRAEAEKGNPALSGEEARAKAEELIKALGFQDFAVAGEEYCYVYSFDEASDENSVVQTGYQVYFTRVLDGIPVTYTHEMGTTVEDETPSWPYETISVAYGENGLLDFLWTDPYNVEQAGEETVFLLPFSDIQAVFEKMIVEKHRDWYEESNVEIFYDINEVRLGYMRVMEKGNPMEGTMIPVWDFFGSETMVFQGEEEKPISDSAYESLLTVNAMDGTVIDRGLGY